MRKVLTSLVLAGLLAVPAAAAGNGHGNGNGNGNGKALDPTAAQALASAPGGSLGTIVTPVSKQDALAAAQLPGASTVVAPAFASTTAAVAASSGCAAYQSGWGWGTWPYDQEVYDHTYYCAVTGQYITYRSTVVTAGGTLCGVDSRDAWVTSGGIGYFWMVVHAQARFSCPTAIPWLDLHPTDWLETAYNAWGNAAQVDNS